MSTNPVYLRYGCSYERATDLDIAGPGIGWSLTRSYASNGTGTTTVGNKWLNGSADMYLFQDGTNISLLNDASSKTSFTVSGSTYTAPDDSYLTLTADTTNHQFILTDKTSNLRWTFNDFTVTNSNLWGKVKEQSSLQWNTQGKTGLAYSYNTDGTISQITTSDGQDYNLVFTWSSGLITQIQVKDASSNLLEQVNYTYYQNVTSPTTDLGSTNDLVQVKISKKATTDASGTLSIVRYTQYRYDSSSNLKAVYEHDAIERAITALSLSTPEALMQKADSFGTPTVQNYATKSFTYYTSNVATSSINTPFATGENLNSEYSGNEASESGFVKTETVGGCGSCGTANSVTKNYFYMDLANSTTDQNQVVRLVVEDTQDSAGSAVYRTVYGFENMARQLRKAFIQNPTTSPTYWCESWKMATAGKQYRLAEQRKPSAHTGVTTSANLQAFLNPYNGTSWSNDTSTVNSSSGLIEVFTYNSNGMLTDSQVKNGSSGTAYYVAAADYGDSVNTALVTASYDYPTETTTRSNGKQTSYSYTFYDSSTHQQIKTKTTTLPTISTSQNGSGVATTMGEYYDNLGRLRWTTDGEGYINYASHSPVTGAIAYQAVDIDPSSPGSDVTSGSSGNWDSVTIGAASSNQPTRTSGLPTPLLLATKTYYDSQGRQTLVTDRGNANHYTTYANTQTIQFPYWNGSQSLVPIHLQNLNSGSQVSDEIDVRASYTAISTSSGAPTGFSTAPSQSDYVAWSHYTYDVINGRLAYIDRYSSIPASGSGTLSTNFYRKVTQYDTLGRQQYLIEVIRGSASNNRVEQVIQYVYDIKDRVIQINRGVSGDTAANSQDMTDNYNSYPTLYTSWQSVYDAGVVGDGYVTKFRTFFGTGSTNYTGVNRQLTYRGHVRGIEPFYVSGSTETPVGPYTVQDVDWKGRATTVSKYTSDPSWSSILTGDGYTAYASSTSTNRATQDNTLYDDMGRIYQRQQYDLSPSSGAGSNSLALNSYYDRNNRQVAMAPAYAAGAEFAYDGAGRQYQTRTVAALQSTLFSSGVFQYCMPTPLPTLNSMSGGDNGVLQLTHRTMNANANVTELDTFEDSHDDVTSTTAAGINLTSNSDYVRRTVFNWYDSANRLITSADYGSGDAASGAGQWRYATTPSRPSTAPTVSASTYLVTLYGYYGDTSLQQTVTDPTGTVTKYFYDNLGRRCYVAENWQNFVPPSTGTGNPNDRVTQYVYDGPDRIQQRWPWIQTVTGTLPITK